MCYPKFHSLVVSNNKATQWFLAVIAALALVFSPHPARAQPQPGAEVNQTSIGDNLSGGHRHVDDNIQWTSWGSNVYALADDGASIWVGGVGSAIRYDKADQTYKRYVPKQVKTHQHIYAVAVDPKGNRWFGGDAGLSSLDATEEWQHFNPENSGIHEQMVVSIAVSADGTIWAGHDLESGSVSRLSPDGSWSWFPTREAAVVANYARILETQNVNRLWTISGEEVWVNLSVYTGTE